jgi:hypothetical protein
MTQNREWTHSTDSVPSHSIPWFSALYYSGLPDRWRKLPRSGVRPRQNETGRLNAPPPVHRRASGLRLFDRMHTLTLLLPRVIHYN